MMIYSYDELMNSFDDLVITFSVIAWGQLSAAYFYLGIAITTKCMSAFPSLEIIKKLKPNLFKNHFLNKLTFHIELFKWSVQIYMMFQ